MFSNKLKRPALALAVTAGLLAVAGPASAQGGDRVGATGLKFETEITDYVRLSTASDVDTPRMGVKWELSEYDAITSGANRLVDKDLNQPDMSSAQDVQPPTPDESILVDLPPLAAKVPQARSAVLPELDANANAFLPEVNDEVLAGLNYEPDYIEGMQ